MRRLTRFLILFLAFSASGIGASSAAGKVWVSLYLAENKPPAEDSTPAPQPLHDRLHEVFGFKHYELLKAQEIGLRDEWEHWFMPRRDFFMCVAPLHHVPGTPRQLDYEIYKDGFIVAKGRYQPQEGTPLFINGPDFKDGRLILVLEPRPPKDGDDIDVDVN